ncbi:MAG: hypothetical protein RIF46_04815 [Cyclobacteriaceae bacterium]
MKRTRNVLMLAALVTLSIFMSCGGGGGGPSKTDGELLVEALISNTWTVNTSSTSVDNVNGTFDESAFSVTFSGTTSAMNYALSGGGLSDYVSGGTFTVDDDANIGSPTVNVVGSVRTGSVTSLIVNSTQTSVRIVLEVDENEARLTGIGTYTLVFDI